MDNARVTHLVNQLYEHFSLIPVMGAELECYVQTSLEQQDGWWQPLHDQWQAAKLPVLRIEKERGNGQYELVLGLDSPHGLVQHLQQLKRDLLNHAAHTGVKVDFAAKPFADQPASGLHLHLHLQNTDGANVFVKDEDEMSEPLRYALGGLIAFMPLAFSYYCPHEADKNRFDDIDHVPRANCWGANNRYCAVRIPSTMDIYDKWLELRVPSSDAVPEDAVAAMLASVLVGLQVRVAPPGQEYGKPEHRFLQDLQQAVVDAPLKASFLGLMGVGF